MNETITYFITWTTYGTWLPGDFRGWRKWKAGEQQPQPFLEDWCREQMKEDAVVMTEPQREAVENICRKHVEIRGWVLHAINARSNHVQLAVTVTAAAEPKKVRDQFKANATSTLRRLANPIRNEKIWTRGGDIEIVDGNENLERVIYYIAEAQDRMDRGK